MDEASAKDTSAAGAESDDDVVICMDDVQVGVVDIDADDAQGEPTAKRRKLNAWFSYRARMVMQLTIC